MAAGSARDRAFRFVGKNPACGIEGRYIAHQSSDGRVVCGEGVSADIMQLAFGRPTSKSSHACTLFILQSLPRTYEPLFAPAFVGGLRGKEREGRQTRTCVWRSH